MAIAVVAGVAVLTAMTLGYGFSKKDGRIEQGGLLQMSSTPTGATVTVNGTLFGTQTPTKLVSQPGNYAVTMQKQGYQTWQKTVPIQAGNITWVAYPRLIPQKLEAKHTLAYPATTASALASASAKRYAVLAAADKPIVSVAMLDSDKPTAQDYTLPAEMYTTPTAEAPGSRFEIESWTGDEKKLLLKHTYGADNKVEWIMLNIDTPAESINLNRSLGIGGSMTIPEFTRGDGMELYAIVDGSVRILDLNDQTLSHPLVDHVVDYRLYGDEFVLYVKEPVDGLQEVGYVRKDYKQPRAVKKVAAGALSAQFDVAKYYDKYYFLVSHGHEAELLSSANLPDDTTSKLTLKHARTLTLNNDVIDANLTDNGQFATIQDGSSFSTFNLEIMKLTTSKLVHGSSPVPQKLKYLDGYLLWGSNDGKLRTYEFDGENQHDIMPVLPALGATLSPSGKYLYGFAQVDDKTIALTRVQLLDIKTE